jgi:hypothetical protein
MKTHTHSSSSSSSTSGSTTITDLIDSFATLLTDGAQLSVDLLQALTQNASSASSTMPSLASILPSLSTSKSKPTHGCSCEIPPACWLPVDAGHCETSACPGATATLRIRVDNCGDTTRDITLEVAGSPSGVTIAPANLNLGPLDEGTSLVTFAVPPAADECQKFKFLIWVRGCKTHYIHWTVDVGDGDCRCRTITIDDCPDYVHHWYDHFYCAHPCQH